MRFIKRIHSVILCIVIIALTCFASVPVSAETLPEYGVIANSSNGVMVRPEAGNFNTDVGGLATGRRVKLLDLVTINNKDHPKWYKLQSVDFPEIIGYVSAKYVEPDAVYVYDEAFEKHLTQQNFPESYKPMLRTLHATYPKWVFLADHLEMTWEEALNAESVSKVSLTDSSYEAWRSVQKDDYNLGSKTYNAHDGSSWFTAEKRVVAYYLDPRNFLNSTSIFQFYVNKYNSSSQNIEGLKRLVSGTFLAGSFPEREYSTYADVIMVAAAQSNVSPYKIASKILTEQGTKGQGKSISGTTSTFPGYYNFFNVGASPGTPYYDSVLNGLYWAKGGSSNSTLYMRPWNSRAKAIIGGAKWFFDEYVDATKSGGYTSYYERFDVAKKPYYNFQYMTNISAANTEGSKLKSAYLKEELSNVFEFRIPVYKNMPQGISSLPSTTGNNDNYLSVLKVTDTSNNSLISFSPYVTEYSDIIVSNKVTYINVDATVNRTGATLSGVGKITLNEGNNKIKVKVVSTSGLERVYEINITRELSQSGGVSDGQPTIDTSVYNVGKYITGITPETSVEEFVKNLNVKNGMAKVFTSSGKSKTGLVGTGDIVNIYNSNSVLISTYNIVIYGDVNSNGKIQVSDILTLRAHHVGNITLSSNVLLEAADVNHSGDFKLSDIILLRAHYVGNATIKQK